MRPGQEHQLDLSAVVVTAAGISRLRPAARRCFSQDEGGLQFYSRYSYKSCVFECRLRLWDRVAL